MTATKSDLLSSLLDRSNPYQLPNEPLAHIHHRCGRSMATDGKWIAWNLAESDGLDDGFGGAALDRIYRQAGEATYRILSADDRVSAMDVLAAQDPPPKPPMPAKVECDVCDGAGYLRSRVTDEDYGCPCCDGDGTVVPASDDDDAGGAVDDGKVVVACGVTVNHIRLRRILSLGEDVELGRVEDMGDKRGFLVFRCSSAGIGGMLMQMTVSDPSAMPVAVQS